MTTRRTRSLSVLEQSGGRVSSNESKARRRQEGKAGWIVLWLIGVPIPLLLILFALRGCT